MLAEALAGGVFFQFLFPGTCMAGQPVRANVLGQSLVWCAVSHVRAQSGNWSFFGTGSPGRAPISGAPARHEVDSMDICERHGVSLLVKTNTGGLTPRRSPICRFPFFTQNGHLTIRRPCHGMRLLPALCNSRAPFGLTHSQFLGRGGAGEEVAIEVVINRGDTVRPLRQLVQREGHRCVPGQAHGPQRRGAVHVMARLRSGDDDAATEVFERFTTRLIALARIHLDSRVRQKVDPEDVLQSVYKSFFLRYAQGQFDFQGWDGLWALLTCITVRKCGRVSRRFHSDGRNVNAELPQATDKLGAEPIQEVLAEGPTPAEVVMLAELVENLLAELDMRDRAIVSLALQGFSAAEISTQLDRPDAHGVPGAGPRQEKVTKDAWPRYGLKREISRPCRGCHCVQAEDCCFTQNERCFHASRPQVICHQSIGPRVCFRGLAGLELVLERFEDAWRRGERPALEDYLAEAAAERGVLLRELVLEDLDYRLRSGEDVRGQLPRTLPGVGPGCPGHGSPASHGRKSAPAARR